MCVFACLLVCVVVFACNGGQQLSCHRMVFRVCPEVRHNCTLGSERRVPLEVQVPGKLAVAGSAAVVGHLLPMKQ